jgi:hypothetical protein
VGLGAAVAAGEVADEGEVVVLVGVAGNKGASGMAAMLE